MADVLDRLEADLLDRLRLDLCDDLALLLDQQPAQRLRIGGQVLGQGDFGEVEPQTDGW